MKARLLDSLGQYKLESNFLLEIGKLTLASDILRDDSIRPLCESHVKSLAKSMLSDFLHAVGVLSRLPLSSCWSIFALVQCSYLVVKLDQVLWTVLQLSFSTLLTYLLTIYHSRIYIRFCVLSDCCPVFASRLLHLLKSNLSVLFPARICGCLGEERRAAPFNCNGHGRMVQGARYVGPLLPGAHTQGIWLHRGKTISLVAL